MSERYYSADNNCVYSHTWVKEFSDGTKSTDRGGLICICPDGINSEVVARKLNLGDYHLSGKELIKQGKIDDTADGRHKYNPSTKYGGFFCADCGYPEHETLKHFLRDQ